MDPAEALRKAVELASALSERRGDVGKVATKIVHLLEQAKSGLAGGMKEQARVSKRGAAQIEYRVEKTAGGETLAEHRTSGSSQPFRCPKVLYDVTVQVLASAAKPLPLEEIAATASAKMGVAAGDFQLRVPLRLWLSTDPPLIVRHRARYRIVEHTFASAAQSLWDRLKHVTT